MTDREFKTVRVHETIWDRLDLVKSEISDDIKKNWKTTPNISFNDVLTYMLNERDSLK